jgi:hypothetical protein
VTNIIQIYRSVYYSQSALHVSGDVFAQLQEHLTVFTVSGGVQYNNKFVITSIVFLGHVARMGEDRGVHRVFVGKPEGRRPLGRPRRRWEDNIKMDLQEVEGGSWGLEGVCSG